MLIRAIASLFAVLVAMTARGLPPAFGLDLAGWQWVTTTGESNLAAVCSVGPDGVVSVVGKPISFIQSQQTWANYRLEVQWRWTGKPGNGGILLHIATGPKDRQWPESYQVQLKHGAAGDLLPMAGATFVEPLSTPPDAKTPILKHRAPDSEKPVGEWNTATITCLGDTITVAINGVLQNRVTGCNLTSGHIGFQLEGTAFELRHLTYTPFAMAKARGDQAAPH